MIKVVVHGGAWNAEDTTVRREEQEATSRSTKSILTSSDKSALDIVTEIVALQENEAALDAGYGSIIQLDGRIRMDAGICTSEGGYGAVVQIEQTANPIQVARKIMEYGYHSILSGDGAVRFAREHGFSDVSLYTETTMTEYLAARKRFPILSYQALVDQSEELDRRKMATVGAVAVDNSGRLAAACSTGGLSYGYPGRVGDTAIYGAGVYCSKLVAVACTGEGDKVLRRLTARRVEEEFIRSGSLQEAADKAVQDLLKEEAGLCGIIAVSHDGQAVEAKSTSFMSVEFIG